MGFLGHRKAGGKAAFLGHAGQQDANGIRQGQTHAFQRGGGAGLHLFVDADMQHGRVGGHGGSPLYRRGDGVSQLRDGQEGELGADQAVTARRAPESPFMVTATRRIAPPMKVAALAVSFRKSQTQSGASITSIFDRSASSAAGTTRLPSV